MERRIWTRKERFLLFHLRFKLGKKRRLDHEDRAIGSRRTKKVKASSAIKDDKLAYEAVVSDFWVGDADNLIDY